MLIAALTAVLLWGCAGPLEQRDFQHQYSLPPAHDAPLWEELAAATAQKQPDWFVPISPGPEALRWRLALIDSATRSLDAKYFIWDQDHSGSLLLTRILRAADNGVQVRLLIDDALLSDATDDWIAAEAHPNVRVRIYNPFAVRSEGPVARFIENLNDFARVNHRMHNKALIADGMVAIMGGRNIADAYHGFGETANFRDFDMLVGGQVTSDISTAYDAFWNSGWAYPADQLQDAPRNAAALAALRRDLDNRESPLEPWLRTHAAAPHDWRKELLDAAERAIPGRARILVDNPDTVHVSAEHLVSSELIRAAGQAREQVVLLTPYLIPSGSLMDTFAGLKEQGIDVRVLTNSLDTNNHIAAHAAYSHHRPALLDAGVALFEYRPTAHARALYEAEGYRAQSFTLHAKILVIDRQRVFVGTFNTDPRSMFINTEIGLLIDSPELSEQVLTLVDPDFQGHNAWQVSRSESGALTWAGAEETLHEEPASSPWRRFKAWLLSLVPMESEL